MCRSLPILCCLLVAISVPAAQLQVADIFKDGAVIPRDHATPIWGQADAGNTVTVEFAGQTVSSITAPDGRWRVSLAAMPATAEPQKMVIRSAGTADVTVGNLLVGDVWLCVGGSAMARRGEIDDPLPQNTDRSARVFALQGETSRIVQNDVHGRWLNINKANGKMLPIQPALISSQLAAKLNVPVGIICVSASLPVESWMSREALAASPEAAPLLAYYDSAAWKMQAAGTYEERVAAWLDYCQKLPLNPPDKPTPGDTDKLTRQEPAGTWNACLAPLADLPVSGVVWDNGEDPVSQSRAFQQGQLLAAMIADWRRAFHNEKLPFVIVQLRPHRYAVPFGLDSRLAAELRDAQRDAAEKSNAALVVTTDLEADPAPATVCKRIADAILSKGYGLAAHDHRGPSLTGSESKDDKIILTFANTRGGLTAKGGTLQGFAIASSLYRWVWADARIDGDTVIVSAPTVPHPEGVRYAYEDLPTRGATLCDGAGNPAAPFRTDNHLAVTDKNLDPAAAVLRFDPRKDLGMEDPHLPRVLIIGDSISGHYLPGLRDRMRGIANVIGEATMQKDSWGSVGPKYYRADTAAKGDDLKNFLAERGPFDIVHFNCGIHNFASAGPGAEVPYAAQLRTAVATIRGSGAVCLFANSTGTVADNTIPRFPKYLSNCLVFNAAAEAVMKELAVPVTDLHGLIQPRIKELISGDLIHTNKEADAMMVECIAKRLTETLASMPKAGKK